MIRKVYLKQKLHIILHFLHIVIITIHSEVMAGQDSLLGRGSLEHLQSVDALSS